MLFNTSLSTIRKALSIFSGGKNVAQLIRGNTMQEPRLEGVFHALIYGFMLLIIEGEVTTLWEGLLGWRVLPRY